MSFNALRLVTSICLKRVRFLEKCLVILLNTLINQALRRQVKISSKFFQSNYTLRKIFVWIKEIWSWIWGQRNISLIQTILRTLCKNNFSPKMYLNTCHPNVFNTLFHWFHISFPRSKRIRFLVISYGSNQPSLKSRD